MFAPDQNPCYLGRLPYELRHEIYLLATPERVVHVREGWEYENEEEKKEAIYQDVELEYAFRRFVREFCDSLTMDLRVHPEIAYFACNWRHTLEDDLRRMDARSQKRRKWQTRLEEYGFRPGRSHHPWEPTAETPALPPEWLVGGSPWSAFELLHKSYLWSQAPIPPLLHACSDSRRIMMNSGYRLAFATRSYEPRTWFHFGRDRLYLKKRPRMPDFYVDTNGYEMPRYTGPWLEQVWPLLSCAPWDIGPFSVADLQKIKHLILEKTRVGHDDNDMTATIGNLLPLLPNLRELWIDEPGTEVLKSCLDRPENCGRELWKSVFADGMDPVGDAYRCMTYNYTESKDVYHHFESMNWRWSWFMNAEKKLPFYELKALRMEDLLSRWNNPPHPLKPPRVRFVHVCPEGLARQLVEERHMFWRYFDSQRALTSKVFPPSGDPQLPPSKLGWYNQFHPMVESLEDTFESDHRLGPPSCFTSVFELQSWYFYEANLPEPSLDIL